MGTFTKIEERLKLLEEKEEHFEKLQEKMRENSEKAKTKIKMDVGGKIFSTSKTTLLQREGTYFHVLLGSDCWKPDEDGCYFIDRDPKYFDRILNYLRNGKLDTQELSKRALEELEEELDYYQITLPEPLFQNLSSRTSLAEPPFQPLFWDPKVKGANILLTKDNKVATKSGLGGWNAAVLGNISNQSFKVKILNRGDATFVIGMALNIKVESLNYDSSGWYLHGRDGTLYSQQGDFSRPYATILNDQSEIAVLFDHEKRQISYVIDGINKGIAFSNIPPGDLYPALKIYGVGISIEIISN